MNDVQAETPEAVTDHDPAAQPTERHEAPADLAPDPELPARPAGVPEKFWDAEAGGLRVDALLKSYRELERRLGSSIALPSDEADQEGNDRLRRALGVPDAPDGYAIQQPHELIEPDPEINLRLHEAGFTPRQAQLVYDLAAERLLPVLSETVADLEATRDAERLASHFGGEQPWRTMARQIKTWGQANLGGDVFETLSSSYDGVLAMHQMMQLREPSVLRDGDGARPALDEAALTGMMRDPRYWRERDPAFVTKVTEGFQRLYPNQG
jgi:hypothetical protein